MKPFNTASGDLIADRRADYAEMLVANGDPAAAAELMLGALELAPGWAVGWFRLGEMHEMAGEADAAERAWRMALQVDPADHSGATLKLALLGTEPQPETPPPAFVEALFDQYADKFDASLVGALDYRVPELLFEAITAAAPGRFARAVDLGCGTGLMGEKLRPLADSLAGYDISAEMLRKARGKNVYDQLEKADLADLPFAGPPADLITAADVFMYLGALDHAFEGIRKMLAQNGVFAFSVERGDEAVALRETRRYAHAETYIRDLLARNSLAILSLETATIRKDRNDDVTGLIVLARKS
ncbi:methyltransferase domain-containing protein [Mesorhizobium sp. RP14(2022)]|uniref:Methyltransferase domain-containing protein n=1 Tax=Mesorhizobium liriopis TaxID=2953882 RepID=A0ABT1C236_9HYPH|nr:methyltransferase domain-containing protein [Mesorhizobium liriopis]MCO6048305.1 methyltransferase domain-containing protein [Mesorhizobium liriopis]